MRWTALVVLAGCSFVIGKRSTKPRPDGTIGCTTNATTAVVDVLWVGAGAFVIRTGETCTGFCPAHQIVEAGVVISVVAAASTIYGLAQVARCAHAIDAQEAKAAHDRDVAAVAAKERAWQLTLEAEQAARADNCARVTALDPQIAALDSGMHDAVFRRDLGVSRCLAAGSGSP